MTIETDHPGVMISATSGMEPGPAINAGASFLVASYEVAERTV